MLAIGDIACDACRFGSVGLENKRVLFFRSILFSFAIFWRMLLVLPFLLIAILVLGIVIGIVGVLLILIFPPLGILVAGAAGYALSSLLTIMVGTRMGLQARGITPRNGVGGLVLPSMGYGLIEMMATLVMVAICGAAWVLLSPLSLQEMLNLFQRYAPEFALMQVEQQSPVPSWVFFLALGFVGSLVRAVLLVPLTGASVGRDPDGRAHTPFWGAGTALLPLFLLVVLSTLITSFAGPVIATVFLGTSLNAQQFNPGDFDGIPMTTVLIFIGIIVLSWIWAICLQCAGGALAYLRITSDAEIFADEPHAPPMDREELRNLWKSRMPPGRK